MSGFWRDSSLRKPSLPISASATGVLTSNNTNVSNNDTVTIGATIYTFKTTLTGAANEVLIGANADASLTNLAAAINGTAGEATTYGNGTVKHSQVTSSAVAAHALTLTAINGGFPSNAIVSTKVAATLTWGAATLTGGFGGLLQSVTIAQTAQTYTTDPLDVGQYAELIMFINIAAQSGTNPTMDCKMQYSDDGVKNWIDSGDSFTQITTVLGLFLKKATANFGKYVRFIITIGGTTPSYTFSFTVSAKV